MKQPVAWGKADEAWSTRKKRRKKRRRRPTSKKRKKKKRVTKKPALPKPVAGRPNATDPFAIPNQTPVAPDPTPSPPNVGAPVDPPDPPPDIPEPANELTVFSGTFDRRAAERLLWRAGFGPRSGEGQALAALGVEAAVRSLTRPSGSPSYTGAAPTVGGLPIDQNNGYGHEHLFWLDRAVRTNQPFKERLALIFHDWFATSNANVGSQRMMIEQYELFRADGLGSFHELTRKVTTNQAMLLWLNGIYNRRGAPDENYGRELMELFTLGAGSGAYTENDVRQMARSLTGWRADWSEELGYHNFRFDPNRWDTGQKTVFGQTGAWDWEDAVELTIEHPLHPRFLVEKLWSYFIPTPPSTPVRQALEHMYTTGNYAIRPLVEAILMSPDFYLGEPMVKPPVVHMAGLMRMSARTITGDSWYYLADGAGQRLFYPPNVSGWNDQRWLDTSTLRGRWEVVNQVLASQYIRPDSGTYSVDEGVSEAVDNALTFWGNPYVSPGSRTALETFSADAIPAGTTGDQRRYMRINRQNALRQLIGISPDLLTS